MHCSGILYLRPSLISGTLRWWKQPAIEYMLVNVRPAASLKHIRLTLRFAIGLVFGVEYACFILFSTGYSLCRIAKQRCAVNMNVRYGLAKFELCNFWTNFFLSFPASSVWNASLLSVVVNLVKTRVSRRLVEVESGNVNKWRTRFPYGSYCWVRASELEET